MRLLIPATVLGLLLSVTDEARCAPQADGPVTGIWVYSGTEGMLGTQECPDFITFATEGRYRVENECAATDPRDPLVETGTWILERSEAGSVLVLVNRKLVADQDFLGEGMSPRIRLLGVNAGMLRLEICPGVTTSGECRIENYRRWTP